MAYTVAVAQKTVVGNMRMHVLSITADAATQSVDTGLDVVYGFSLAPVSMATSAIKMYKNALAAGTASAGYLAISGAASADEMQVIVYGR